MKNILLLLIIGLSISVGSCSALFAPSEPTATDELEPRVEPESYDSRYPPEIEEEIESDEAPLETEEMEQQPLIK
ncbi:MAG: hypothetical protein O6830_07515 [Candidatus Dadabacteria bacterium]|nr:hypothetical protein [Candidatus Dadabacteria bacterium]